MLSSCDRQGNEALTANRRAASPEFRVAAPRLPGRVRSSEILTGAFLLLLLAVHRSKAGFFFFFFCTSLLLALQFFPFVHPTLGTQGANRQALRHCLMPNRDWDDQTGRRRGTRKEEKGTMLHVQGLSPTSSCRGAGREKQKNRSCSS